jgi:hypothetical protein
MRSWKEVDYKYSPWRRYSRVENLEWVLRALKNQMGGNGLQIRKVLCSVGFGRWKNQGIWFIWKDIYFVKSVEPRLFLFGIDTPSIGCSSSSTDLTHVFFHPFGATITRD